MNRFAHHAAGYAGPTLVLARTAAGEVFGGYVDAPWRAGAKYFGGQGCFLVTLAPAFHVYRATATATNYAYFNPPKTGQLQSSRYGAEQLPETFGFGGAPARQRLGFDDDLNQLVWHSADTSFAAHPAGAGDGGGVGRGPTCGLTGAHPPLLGSSSANAFFHGVMTASASMAVRFCAASPMSVLR